MQNSTTNPIDSHFETILSWRAINEFRKHGRVKYFMKIVFNVVNVGFLLSSQNLLTLLWCMRPQNITITPRVLVQCELCDALRTRMKNIGNSSRYFLMVRQRHNERVTSPNALLHRVSWYSVVQLRTFVVSVSASDDVQLHVTECRHWRNGRSRVHTSNTLRRFVRTFVKYILRFSYLETSSFVTQPVKATDIVV